MTDADERRPNNVGVAHEPDADATFRDIVRLGPPESDDGRGVSPVIGVILMVAITVVLATVIGATVLDFTNQIGDQPLSAGVSIDGSQTDSVEVTLTNRGNTDGVAIVDDDGSVTGDDGVLDATGETVTITDSGTYTVQAYEGTVDPDAATIDDTASRNTIVGEFEVDES
jgi:flagellin-like protein